MEGQKLKKRKSLDKSQIVEILETEGQVYLLTCLELTLPETHKGT
jgi:hypothetical protein